MKNYTKLTLLVMCVFLSNLVFSQKDFNLHLHAGEVSQDQFLKPSETNSPLLRANQIGTDYFVMVQFDHHLSLAEKNKLKTQGIELQEYIPNFAYIAKISSTANLTNSIVKFIIPFRPIYKYSIELVKNKIPTHAVIGNEVRLNVMKFDGISMTDFLSTLRIKGYDAEMISERMAIVQIELTNLEELASVGVVKYIEPVHPDPVKEGLRGRSVQRVNMISKGPGDGYDGAGVMLGLADDGGVSHVDFKGRLTDFTANEGGTHGDMTAGLAIGAGNINPLGMGMATGADLNLYDFNGSNNNPPVTNAIANFNTYGQVISSTSYSESSGAQYTERSNFVDNQLYNNNQLLHFFSAGNSSSSNSSPVYGGILASNGGYFGNITGGTKAAKNTIAVANMLYNDVRVGSSSRGPTADGRVKPDISAHGNGNLSLDPNNQYGAGGGTSAAAPSTAGTVAMLYDAYRDLNSGANPNGGLIKATILNTADDIGRAGPDYDHGWGRIHAGNAYEVISNNQYTSSSISNNGSNTHTIAVPSGTKEIKVMVLWIDPAGATNASIALVNDINITMTTPSGQNYEPWILGLDPTLASLEAEAVRGIDNRNNMEQVSLENPAAGNYTINVSGFDIPQGPQEYFLVYHFTPDEITVTYPNGDGEPMVPGVEEPLRWDAFGNTGNFTVEYSINNGASWTNISSSVPGGDRYLNWTPPAVPTGVAKIKVSRNGQSDESDNGFTIMEEPNFSIVSGANNEAVISWDAIPGATSYDVFRLEDKYMEVLGSTATTSFTLQNLVLGESNWYSVRAMDAGNNIIGRRAYAKEYRYYVCHVDITVNVLTDDYPGETSWSIFDDMGNEIVTGGGYSQQATNYSTVACVPFGCMDFVIYDSYGDGICCGFGQGSYQVVGPAGQTLASGGQFGFSESTNFCLQSAPLVLELTNQTNISCNGGNDGTITVQASGGIGSFTYSINGGTAQASNTFIGLPAGTHVVTVNDGSSTISLDVILTEPDVLLAILNSHNDISCNGLNDGWAIVDGIGGTNNSGGYTYSIDNGTFTSSNSFFNLSSGAHEVKVRDDNDCEGSISIIILEPAELLSFVVSETSIDCNGNNNGAVVIESSGGNSPFTYSFNGGTYSSSNTFENLAAGVYEVATLDNNLCEHSFSVTVTEPPVLEMTVETQVDITCFGENDGLIELSGQGGTGDLTYQINNQGFQNNPVFSNLPQGTHNLEVMDENGCITSSSVEISEPQEIQIALTNQINASCANSNGAITINVSGGVGTPTINFNGNSVNGNPATFENLGAGVFPISITDENNCVSSSSVEINEDSSVELQITNTQNILCNGGNNGMIEAQSSGGSGNYTYSLNGTSQGNNNIFTSLPAGTYLIGSTDDLGCMTETTVTITEPIAMAAQVLQQNNVNCFEGNNGSATIQVQGGNGTLEYTLGSTSNTTGEFNNLPAGNYDVIILDENNCTATINFEITQPTEVVAEITNNTSVSCFGANNGSLQVAAAGGVSNFEFTIGTETNTTGIFNNLPPGTYQVAVVDGNNCPTTIEAIIEEPSELTGSISAQQSVDCFGGNTGSISFASNGGAGSVTYTLNGMSNSTGDFSNLSSGIYEVELTDENGCSTAVEFEIDEPLELTASISTQQSVDCFGENNGSISLNSNGGVGTITYTLNGSSNTTGDFSNLSSGIYTVDLVDENDCATTMEFEIDEPAELTASISTQQSVICFGENTGSVSLNTTGGSGTITYTLNGVSNTTGDFSNLSSGIYEVDLVDENGCATTMEFEVDEPTELNIELESINQVACSGLEGEIEVSANGGTGDYEFSLNNLSNSTGGFTNLSGGIYLVQVTDGNGCTATLEVDINEPNSLSASVLQTQNITCNGELNGSVQLAGQGGTGILTYTLGTATNTTGFFENLPAGNYTVLVEDDNNCTSQIDVVITEPNALEIEMLLVTEVNCYGSSDGQVNLLSTGGTGNIQYTLGTATNTTGVFENLEGGTYDVLLEDENGCTTSTSITLDEPLELEIQVLNNSAAGCGISTGFVEVQGLNGIGSYSYQLNNETNTTGLFENLASGDYEILMIDGNGCALEMTITIVEDDEISIENMTAQNVNCFGNETGNITVLATSPAGNISYELNGITNTTGVFDNLPAGNYEVIVSDGNECSEIVSFEITEPSEMEVTNTIVPIECFDGVGEILVEAFGANGGFNYTLDGETNETGLFQNLHAGTFEVEIVDASGCTQIETIELEQPDQLFATVNQTTVDMGIGDGTVTLEGSGGTGTYLYSINGQDFQSGALFIELLAGDYEGSILDENGCISTVTFTILLETAIQNPAEGIEKIEVMPNPFSEKLFLNVELEKSQNLELTLWTISGIQVFQKTIHFQNGNSKIDLDVNEQLAAGAYFLKVENGNGSIGHFKLIKQ
ncbi:MAG: S8 family serine peptidase [Saprospiraceae bacterium]